MGMGQGVRTGLGHEGITCVLQTRFSRVRTGLGHEGITCVLQTRFSSLVFFFFFFFFLGGGGGGGGGRGTWPFTLREHWKITHYF